MSVIEDLGDALARDVIAAAEELGDERFFDKVAKVVGDASPTLLESYTTAYRVRIAELRARKFVEASLKAKKSGGLAPVAPRGSDSSH
ncbi:MAG: hypothetical protein B7Y02_03945 [Rhodobacterales bacterium 17-64-5]|nr:MAG: hypothetical protein B7Y02_03945 [Rhodobacterales bacterium 17-64-5]